MFKDRNGTNPSIPVALRSRRDSGVTKTLKIGAFIIALCGFMITLGGLIWALATGLTNKATKNDIESVKKDVSFVQSSATKSVQENKEKIIGIEKDVDRVKDDVKVIKREQRMLIRALRPNLPIGSDDDE